MNRYPQSHSNSQHSQQQSQQNTEQHQLIKFDNLNQIFNYYNQKKVELQQKFLEEQQEYLEELAQLSQQIKNSQNSEILVYQELDQINNTCAGIQKQFYSAIKLQFGIDSQQSDD